MGLADFITADATFDQLADEDGEERYISAEILKRCKFMRGERACRLAGARTHGQHAPRLGRPSGGWFSPSRCRAGIASASGPSLRQARPKSAASEKVPSACVPVWFAFN